MAIYIWFGIFAVVAVCALAWLGFVAAKLAGLFDDEGKQ